MKHFVLAGLSAMSVSSYAQETVNDTLFYTGSEQTWTVPCGATNIVIDAFGARGAAGSTINPTINSGGAAGLGNRVTGNWSVLEASDVLYIYVGGKANGSVGGFNGGGNGVAIQNDYPSGGGGGATDIRFPSNALADRIQVAGGGGGGGNAGSHGLSGAFSGGNGGNGGGNQQLYGNSLAGADGEAASETPHVSPGALGGTTGTPGLAAEGCSGFLGTNGGANTNEIGGTGGAGISTFGMLSPSGGGGGGGHQGGTGGGGGSAGTTACSGNAFGAGGGGSAGTNYFDGPATNFENGINNGDGYVVISYELAIDSADIVEPVLAPCVGETITLSAFPSGGLWTGAAVSPNGQFSPTEETSYEVIYTGISCGISTSDTLTIAVDCSVLDVRELQAEIQLVPSPASDYITILGQTTGDIHVIDIHGQVLISIADYQSEQISINHLTAGIYFVALQSMGKTTTTRFVKH